MTKAAEQFKFEDLEKLDNPYEHAAATTVGVASKPEESRKAVDLDDPLANARARVSLLGDRSLAEINRVVRAVNRDYQLDEGDWEKVVDELYGGIGIFVDSVYKFVNVAKAISPDFKRVSSGEQNAEA